MQAHGASMQAHGEGPRRSHGGEAGAGHGDDVEQAEVAEGGDQRHEQAQRAPDQRPAPT